CPTYIPGIPVTGDAYGLVLADYQIYIKPGLGTPFDHSYGDGNFYDCTNRDANETGYVWDPTNY
ncbi:MAG TPA: hypothetical protein VMJ35_07815, partial [Dongiaceae bacterium]|nr:hypothetical protein [Dongiaceae bacterium]